MLRLLAALLFFVASLPAQAVQLSCSEDSNTRQRLCYNPKAVRSNGDLRAVRLYKGGPNGADDTGFTAVLNCKVGYLEMRDKQGVVFARDQPEKLYVVLFRDYVCGEKQHKHDKSLN
ncbi:hypothetical protein SCT_0607 [Sulfuricella sp. T08]|uniref:hypothetical protein n=1 Tax=Sulfuricella sp. T08 TaxID=1632857 RepID=UPI0006179A0E|nr:hypothetical protein [Sulfuricella sp. T08]GAO35223.1 hypothetical protein SCT_0607 [Sulfuricella sp. T08]